MAIAGFSPAPRRFYFVGVTTGRSSIRPIFPHWCAALGIDAELVGIDLPVGAAPGNYRAALRGIQDDPQAAGALVTAHKLAVIEAAADLFASLDRYAQQLREVSCIVRRPDGSLEGSAKDPITSVRALERLSRDRRRPLRRAHLLCLGAGGAGQALAAGCLTLMPSEARPELMILADRSPERLVQAKAALEPLRGGVPLEYAPVPSLSDADRLLEVLPPGSLVVNATGLGKDLPGSPLSDAARLPEGGIAWDFNYRGDLGFLEQARRQQEARRLEVCDGWNYFLYGWTEVMAAVFGLTLDEAIFRRLAAIAEGAST